MVYSTAKGLHLPLLADEIEADADEVEHTVAVEATHVEATVETDEGIVHAEATHVEAEVAAVTAPAVAAIEAPREPFVENGPGIVSFVAPASALSPAEPVSPVAAQPPAAIVAWPGAGARS